jgi:hypothetical protein
MSKAVLIAGMLNALDRADAQGKNSDTMIWDENGRHPVEYIPYVNYAKYADDTIFMPDNKPRKQKSKFGSQSKRRKLIRQNPHLLRSKRFK